MIGKIRDTLIGLWPVIKTYVPKPGMIIAVIVAFVIGLIWSYAVDPVIFHDGDPRSLGQTWQDEWVRLVAERYGYAASNAIITDDFRQSVIALLRSVDNPQEIVNRLSLLEIGDLAGQAQVGAPLPPAEPNLWLTIRPFLIGPIVLAVAFVVGSLLFGFYINPMLIEPIRKRLRGSQGKDLVGGQAIQDIQRARQIRDELSKAPPQETDLGPPVVRHVSIYNPGRAYDDSFSIEDATRNDEFLGECGAVVSEKIGTGQQEKATGIEVWLFDKEDFVRTLTTVFASEYAFNDPALRSEMSAKGEVVLAQPGVVARLETNTLRLQARIIDMAYGTGPLPPNSYFDRMTIELTTWRRSAIPGGAPAVSPAPAVPLPPTPAPSYAPPAPTFAPPTTPTPVAPSPYAPPKTVPLAPQSAPPSYGGGLTPLKPPPLQPPPRKQDDDPFGGTGNFDPVN
ncbi:MAG: hypothetical protein JNM70_11390 [Anaerolineae bacterium]|nr:hypothetical protein [Anaerolineae bacterium]